MSRPHALRRRRGFTLVEGIAAIVLLALSVPPMLWALRQAHVQRVNPAMASTARWLVQEKIEDVIADAHSPTRGYAYVSAGNYSAEPAVADFPGFARSVQLLESGADLVSAGSGYKRVTVSVSWTDATGVGRSLDVTTVLTDQGTP